MTLEKKSSMEACSTLYLSLSYVTREDMIVCITIFWVESFYVLEVGPTFILYFRFLGSTC